MEMRYVTVTGLNEARDGSSPDPNSLVGLTKTCSSQLKYSD
jgi:hypothetical protein